MGWFEWRPYVPVWKRRARAQKEMNRLKRKGVAVQGVQPRGRSISETFWGRSWCAHLEKFSDFANRLPRGRSYVRNGSVCHLEVAKGKIEAIVSGSELYDVKVTVSELPRTVWADVKRRCSRGIGSLLELLQGRLSDAVMSVVTDRDRGLFPKPREIRLSCSCPDWATMCKHVAAVLYGVGVRLDEKPELLFLLRGVDAHELVAEGAQLPVPARKGGRRIADSALSEVFGIELAGSESAPLGEAPRGGDIKALRLRFGMSRMEFARLIGVSAPAIGLWEKRTGAVRMQARGRRGWDGAKGLTREEAWKRVSTDGRP